MKGFRLSLTLGSKTMMRPEVQVVRPRELVSIDDLYRMHAATVARWASRLGGPDIDPEDIVHEVFLVAHRRFGEFRGEAKPETWLFRTTDLIVRAHRRKARLHALLRRSVAEERDWTQRRSAAISPVEDMIERQRARSVYRALEGMDHKYRSVFVLFELEGLSGDEIAALTGIKVATVWVRLHRARERFVRRIHALVVREEDRP